MNAPAQPNTPRANEASWYHADETEGGPYNHSAYDPLGSGHPGLVTVVVSDAHWSCTATFQGTQGSHAEPVSDGPDPSPDDCVAKQ